MSFFLVLLPCSADPTRKVGGLSLALRLSLDAQRAGAVAVVHGDDVPAATLADPRLRIPVLRAPPADATPASVPACLVAHRDAFAAAKGGEPFSLSGFEAASEAAPFGFRPVLVTDASSAREAERVLFRSLRKPQDGWTARALNRPISLTLSRWLVRTPLRPNQVSVAILLVGIAGALLASRGTYGALVGGAALFHAQSVLDGCDGEMSRVTYRGSLLGEWLDTIGDDLTNYGFFAGAAWGLYHRHDAPIYAVAGIVTVACGLIVSAIEYRYLYRIGSGDLLKYPLSQTHSGDGPLAFIAPLFKRDTFVFLTLVAAVLDLSGPMLILFSLGAIGILVSVFAAELRMARERRASPAQPPSQGR